MDQKINLQYTSNNIQFMNGKLNQQQPKRMRVNHQYKGSSSHHRPEVKIEGQTVFANNVNNICPTNAETHIDDQNVDLMQSDSVAFQQLDLTVRRLRMCQYCTSMISEEQGDSIMPMGECLQHFYILTQQLRELFKKKEELEPNRNHNNPNHNNSSSQTSIKQHRKLKAKSARRNRRNGRQLERKYKCAIKGCRKKYAHNYSAVNHMANSHKVCKGTEIMQVQGHHCHNCSTAQLQNIKQSVMQRSKLCIL